MFRNEVKKLPHMLIFINLFFYLISNKIYIECKPSNATIYLMWPRNMILPNLNYYPSSCITYSHPNFITISGVLQQFAGRKIMMYRDVLTWIKCNDGNHIVLTLTLHYNIHWLLYGWHINQKYFSRPGYWAILTG